MIRDKLPTKSSDVKVTLRVCRLVFTKPSYALLFVLLNPIIVVALILPTDYALIRDVVLLGNDSLSSRISLLYNLFPLVGGYSYALFTDCMTYVVSMSVSANITLLTYHLIEHGLDIGDTASSTTGSILSVLGAGCASCGSSILAGVFSLLGISGILTSLPLKGGEFLLIAFFVSILSIYWISDGLRGGTVRGCPID